MKPWEYSPKLETVTKPFKPEVVQKTDDVAASNRHPFETARPLVYLPAILLQNLMVWTSGHHELRVTYPGGVILNAQPHHVRDAVERHPWGVVYDSERYLLMSWGDVPTYEVQSLRDLERDELLAPETVAA